MTNRSIKKAISEDLLHEQYLNERKRSGRIKATNKIKKKNKGKWFDRI